LHVLNTSTEWRGSAASAGTGQSGDEQRSRPAGKALIMRPLMTRQSVSAAGYTFQVCSRHGNAVQIPSCRARRTNTRPGKLLQQLSAGCCTPRPRAASQRRFAAASGGSGTGGGDGRKGGSGGGGGGGGKDGEESEDSENSRKQHPPLLTRYPEASVGGFARLLDYIGTVLFAISGSLTATASGLDLFGATLVGIVTAVGGGSLRDIVIGRQVFWLEEFEYFWLAGIAAAGCRLLGPGDGLGWWPAGRKGLPQGFAEVMKWGDAVAVGTFAIIGAHNGLRLAAPLGACLLFGMMTATFGGAVRDVICNRPVRIMHKNSEMYATVALASAGAYTAATHVGLTPALRVCAGISVAIAGRWLALSRDPALLRSLLP